MAKTGIVWVYMNTLSQCSVFSCKSVYEGSKHLFVIAQHGVSKNMFSAGFWFFLSEKNLQDWNWDQLIGYVWLTTKEQNHFISVSWRTKPTGLEMRWSFYVPVQPFKDGRLALLPFRPVLAMSFLSLAYIHKLQHTEEFPRKHAGPVSWLTLTWLWNLWELFPCALSTLCLSPERDPFPLSGTHIHRQLGDFLMCDEHCVYMCPCIYTCEYMTQNADTNCPS